MTKVEAVAKILKEKGGQATWEEIYANIEKHYKGAKGSRFWQEGIRGVVYREIRYGRTFEMAGKGTVCLKKNPA